jgi:hypothetical protein
MKKFIIFLALLFNLMPYINYEGSLTFTGTLYGQENSGEEENDSTETEDPYTRWDTDGDGDFDMECHGELEATGNIEMRYSWEGNYTCVDVEMNPINPIECNSLPTNTPAAPNMSMSLVTDASSPPDIPQSNPNYENYWAIMDIYNTVTSSSDASWNNFSTTLETTTDTWTNTAVTFGITPTGEGVIFIANNTNGTWNWNTGIVLPHPKDCAGVEGGRAYIDDCQTCVGGNTGRTACVQDCNGVWGGSAYIDNCNTCVGGNTGRTACVQDCNGIWGGTAYIDSCGVCVGGNTGQQPCNPRDTCNSSAPGYDPSRCTSCGLVRATASSGYCLAKKLTEVDCDSIASNNARRLNEMFDHPSIMASRNRMKTLAADTSREYSCYMYTKPDGTHDTTKVEPGTRASSPFLPVRNDSMECFAQMHTHPPIGYAAPSPTDVFLLMRRNYREEFKTVIPIPPGNEYAATVINRDSTQAFSARYPLDSLVTTNLITGSHFNTATSIGQKMFDIFDKAQKKFSGKYSTEDAYALALSVLLKEYNLGVKIYKNVPGADPADLINFKEINAVVEKDAKGKTIYKDGTICK